MNKVQGNIIPMKTIILIACVFIFISCVTTPIQVKETTENQGDKSLYNSRYNGSLYQGNFVWGGAMNLAWNDLCQSILKEPLQLNSKDPIAQQLVANFNKPVFTTNDIDKQSYYVKSGYGKKTINTINKEVKQQFPNKSFAPVSIPNFRDNDIISYAYFMKEVSYPLAFKNQKGKFKDQDVAGFFAQQSTKKNISILYYDNPNKFILQLKVKEQNEDLILAKGFDMNTPIDFISFYQSLQDKPTKLMDEDRFWMPKIDLDMQRNYTELTGKALSNAGFKDYVLSVMQEKIKFKLDETGAKVENEAVIGVQAISARVSLNEPKSLILDQPFWVMMKQKNSTQPYFLLGVNNANILNNKDSIKN